ncbi:MAG: hypothetical protein ABII82_15590 [Verrucomicrobiota bacterium]
MKLKYRLGLDSHREEKMRRLMPEDADEKALRWAQVLGFFFLAFILIIRFIAAVVG